MENKKTNLKNTLLNEQELENINGGKFITTNICMYFSGSEPKYHIGQTLYILLRELPYRCKCSVVDVSKTATGGTIFKEFVYDIRIHSSGELYTGVYESCLYTSAQ